MVDKLINIVKDKQYVIGGLLLKNYRQLNITSEELILLIYLINNKDISIFDPKRISLDLNVDKKEIMMLVSSLSSKKIISLEVIKNKMDKMEEHLNLDNLFYKLADIVIDEKSEASNNSIFAVFEKEFGRTISPMEYEIINSWLHNNIAEKLILEALKEAIYNGVTSLRYIDKILFEWKKKGIKTVDDVKKNNEQFKKKDHEKAKDIFEYNWLDEEE